MARPLTQSSIFVETVQEMSESSPDQSFVKLLFAGRNDLEISYKSLIQNAHRFAHFLKAQGVGKNDVVIVLLNHGAELIHAFVGAMLLGAVPSLFAPPSVKIPAEVYEKTLALLLQVCGSRFLVTSSELAREVFDKTAVARNIQVLTAEEARSYSDKAGENISSAPSDIILLQHSSGTTGLKKGVALSNQSVMNQIRNYAQAIQLSEKDKMVSWLPLYHDMGLIACFLLPMATGVPLILMSPFDWVANPLLLFQAISKERGTLCWLPNFAYHFLASRIPDAQMKGLDLNSMRAFINCAEPISASSHQIFYERFKKNGVKKESLCTCYAMAENTFAVTQGGILEPVKKEEVDWSVFTREHKAVLADKKAKVRRELVASGKVIGNNRVRIVDKSRRDLPGRSVGEIAIQSDSMLTEYYHRPDLTREALENGWYFTGDLGYLADGHLFVTGRKKDMIIVAGKNIYPQDLEEVASSIAGIHPGRVVAFGIYNEETGTEEVVILAETDVRAPAEQIQIKLEMARFIREQLECIANEIVLLPPMWLLKSSSGKISRSGNREKYFQHFRGQNDELV